MRRSCGLTLILALAFGLGTASSANASLYVGREHGTRITFRVEGRRVVWADITTHLYCKLGWGGRVVRRKDLGFANARNPLRIDGSGIFRQIERPGVQGEGFQMEEALIGHVGPHLIKGRLEYSYVEAEGRWEECQTARFPYGSPLMRFRARRVG